ncbi:OLC1v1017600C1 [Oldenlandia corymbosa var. corymbosa]|uniref:very-long-chain 3-oxoacyl-CoA synthase n=1 Tax=Oldenlandia corymbosa var. corymbosa TaxID=529605 RepID=A0AAV1E9S8_OLDCO|nr:OLC1v1017600C1 [Oldenlandia corymbosa var. corymbosa]
MRNIYFKSGLGDETYGPPFIFDEENDVPTLDSAMQEAREGVFSSVDALLSKTGIDPSSIDVVIVTCGSFSPFPSLSSLIVNHYNLRPDVKTFNLSGMGCSSGVLSIDFAARMLRSSEKVQNALVVITESITLNWYSGDNRSMLVTNCIFRVGCTAAMLTNDPTRRRVAKMQLVDSLRTHHGADDRSYRAAFQEEDENGFTGVALTKDLIRVAGVNLTQHITLLAPRVLPLSQLASYAYSAVTSALRSRAGESKPKPAVPDFTTAFQHMCIHTGGKAVIEQVGRVLRLSDEVTEPARMTLNRFGNTSSSLVFYELAYFEAKERVKKGDTMWMIAFGTGFKVGSLVWKWLQDSSQEIDNPWNDSIDSYPLEAWPVNDLLVAETDDEETDNLDRNEVLEDFYKLFKSGGSLPQESDLGEGLKEAEIGKEGRENVNVEYYEPKPGDLVVGVVVSGNENKLDVNVGADLIGTMLTKEVLPLYHKEMNYMLCDMEKDAEEFMVNGKVGIMNNDEAVSWEDMPGRPVVEPGTILFAEVLGRTLSGRPLLSTRRLFRRLAWHRVRQIKQLNEPIRVKITEWNTGGLLTRIEGLRAFLPKIELMNRINNYTDLKDNVGRWLYVLISRINEDTNDLILSEKDAWEMLHLREGTLLEGTVKKIFPYGAQIRIGETNRSGLLHVSKISRARIDSVSNVLAVDEKVKVLVVKSMFPDKISLSIADLESEPGLFLSNKEKVFSEAEEMAKKYRRLISPFLEKPKLEPVTTNVAIPFEDEENSLANWKWFKFETDSIPDS